MSATAPETAESSTGGRSSILTSAVIASRFIPVWIAIALLLVLILAIAPDTLSATSLTLVLPLTSFLAIAALGEMLVIMTGGIDLSVPGVMTLAAMVTVGVGSGSDDRLLLAIGAALGAASLVGLANGILVGVLKLNALIITLAVGQVVRGASIAYAALVANEASVPSNLSTWATSQFLSVGWIFWVGIAVTLLLSAFLRFTKFGRRFQSVGANPLAAWNVGIRVNGYVIFAYFAASLLYGLGGILLAGFIGSPTLGLGAPYLLGPIAAVVIGGASLTGGLASAISTWAAAFFLVLLSQMLRVLGLPTSLQFVVFGAAIIGGMVVSGDRIITVVEHLFQGTPAGSKGLDYADDSGSKEG
ncbi:MAG: ABC transporter permease [Anaerolineales bacterium]|nr:ABC transporter permease [Anaerolineales bacterium]